MLSPGSTFGTYRIEGLLGEGAMGVVYRALDLRLDRPVALKLIREELGRSEDFRLRLSDEARKAAKIDSPYVVKVWEHSTVDDQPYISLELITGDDLRTAAASLSFTQKLDIVLQIAEGLKAAHAQGLVHRDLKPENIKITQEGQAKILDFGLAKTVQADSVDDQGNIEGTLHYLSPEQVCGEALTGASDIFSFGTILFELFTGSRPFEGVYPAAIVYSILHEDPALPSLVDPGIPQWLDAVIVKSLAKLPVNRFSDARSLIEALRTGRETSGEGGREPFAKPHQTVTVVDINNLSGDANWDYFCVGFTEDVIHELSRRTDLVVSAQASSLYSRNIREVFERCHSDYVIVGSLRKWQDRIKLHLSIYGSNGDKLISGEDYEDNSEKLFNMLSQAARDAAVTLANVTGFSAIEVDDYLKTNVSAYEYYLKGRSYYQTNKPEDLDFAVMMFLKALEIDPGLALAHAGLSDVYSFKYMAYYDRSPRTIEMAKTEARRAIEISPNLPEAHRSLGRYYMFTGNMSDAELAFLKSVEYSPKFAIGYRTLAWLKELEGNHERALYWAKRSLELAPCDLETLLLLSLLHMDTRKYTVAMATLQRAIELGPDYGRAYFLLGSVYMKLGVPELALENFLLAAKYKGDPNCCIDAGYIYLAHKDFESAKHKFLESIEAGYFPFVAYYYLGFLEAKRGDKKRAEEYFRESVKAGEASDSEGSSDVHVRAYRALAIAWLGDADQARAILDELVSLPKLDGELLYEVARCYAVLGDESKTNDFVSRALEGHAGPTEKEIRFDPHFASISH
jgi:serine/threonine protein kinase/Tfp pilus assembly protein PilF